MATFVENIHRRLNEGGGANVRVVKERSPPAKKKGEKSPFRWLDEEARSMVFGVGGRLPRTVFDRRHEALTTVRAVAATRRCAQRPTRSGANQQEVSVKRPRLPSERVPSRPVPKYGQVINELRGDRSVYGRRSCRFLLHLSVPEGLQTLCTEFRGRRSKCEVDFAGETVAGASH